MAKIFKGFKCEEELANRFYDLPGNKSEILEGLMKSYLESNKNFDVAAIIYKRQLLSEEIINLDIEIENKLAPIMHNSLEEDDFIKDEIPKKLKMGIDWDPITNLFNAKFKRNLNPLELREVYYGFSKDKEM